MTDPAVEAAKRAWENEYPSLSAFKDGVGSLIIGAAREALKPIRELHYVAVVDWDDHRVCATCWGTNGPVDWPCATAFLVYTEEELS